MEAGRDVAGNVVTARRVKPRPVTETAELRARIVERASQIHAAEAGFVAMLAELHTSEGWAGDGYTSMAHWVQVHCGFTPTDARRRCTTAAKAEQMPAVLAAAAEGRVSSGMAAAAARHVEWLADDRLVEVITLASPAQSLRVMGHARRLAETRTTDDQPAPEPETWHRSWHDDDGMYRYEGRAHPDDGALLDRALDAARTAGWNQARADRGEGEPVAVPTNAEAMAHLAETMLAHAHDEGLLDRFEERFTVGVTIDVDALLGAGGECHLERGAPLPTSTGRQLCCDAAIQAVIERNGIALALGRETKTPTRAIRRALKRRDGGCVFPGCGQTRFVDAHHVIHWTNGGPTDLDNLALLCRRHHRALHRGAYDIDMIDQRPVVTTTNRHTTLRPPPHHCRDHLHQPHIPPDAATPRARGEHATHDALDTLILTLLS